MKLGFGFYHHMLTRDNFAFAAQCGATHAVVHLVDYTHGGAPAVGDRDEQPIGDDSGWGVAGSTLNDWTESSLHRLVAEMATYGIAIEAIENFDPADWHDVLLGGPRRDEQIETIKDRIRAVGQAGIPQIGYNFSLTGVASRTTGAFARGGAVSVGMTEIDTTPVPAGMVWNMWYDRTAGTGGRQPTSTVSDLWDRWRYFADEVFPVAEANGVALAAHPDDPPVEEVRGQPKFIWRPDHYQRLIDYAPSTANRLEFCVGTLAEMPDHDIYETVERYAGQHRIGYVHLRNVAGTAPHYTEQFIDDGDVDMRRVVSILKSHGFDGVVIADHTPRLECAAPWHAGIAYAMGYIRALLQDAAPGNE